MKPNILWIYLEDTSPLMGCYGFNISTPNIDQLAKEGVLFANAFMPAPVCSPCRSTIITGVMSTTIGAHNHHSARTESSSIPLPEEIKTIPELFRQAGYFAFNNGKDDYNFTYDRKKLYEQSYLVHPIYGKKGIPIDLAELESRQPFFGQIQLPGGKEIFSKTFSKAVNNPFPRKDILLPPYLPYDSIIIEEYADHLDAIQITDEKVGQIISALRAHQLLDRTIVFFFSDHGMRLTRHKQFLYDGGLRVPLIVVDFTGSELLRPGLVDSQLVSGIDLGPTALGLCDIDIPEGIEGVDIFNPEQTRPYVISTRDRCDFTIDRIRSVRSRDFKYVRNFLTDRPYTQPTYMDVDKVPFVGRMKELYEAQKLDSVQARFFSSIRPAEELYDLKNDPYELVNLATGDSHSDTLAQYRQVLDQWIEESGDKGQYPEDEENLKYMLSIWGNFAVNPEYAALRESYPKLSGSLFSRKGAKWKTVE